MKSLVDDLRVKYVVRIGKSDTQRNRPIKVSFESEKEKNAVLQSF